MFNKQQIAFHAEVCSGCLSLHGWSWLYTLRPTPPHHHQLVQEVQLDVAGGWGCLPWRSCDHGRYVAVPHTMPAWVAATQGLDPTSLCSRAATRASLHAPASETHDGGGRPLLADTWGDKPFMQCSFYHPPLVSPAPDGTRIGLLFIPLTAEIESSQEIKFLYRCRLH